MTREEIEKARDLLKMIEVKEPNELIVNSWWGSFAKDYKEALQIAIKVLEQEPCEDCVSRKDMLAVLRQSNSLSQAWEGFEKLPSVSPKEKIGHWIIKNDNIAIPTGYYQCSECEEGKLLNKDNFCPNCGARMEVESEKEC